MTRAYALRQAVRRPVAAYRRRRLPDLDPIGRAMLEAHQYRRSMLDFMAAAGRNPAILHEHGVHDGALVLDVGAFVGDWAAGVRERADATVHAFEPSHQAVDTLRERFAGDGLVVVHPFGLGARDEQVQLALAGPGSSVTPDRGAFGAEPAEIRDVVAVLDDLAIDRVDLMKVNIEGGEYELLERLIAADRIDRVGVLLVQFHEWLPGAHRRRRRIREALARSHRELWNHPWVFECWVAGGRAG